MQASGRSCKQTLHATVYFHNWKKDCAILMALWPVAETLGLGMEQTQQSKHSVSTWDVMKMKKKAIPQIVPTDNSVLIFFLRDLWFVLTKQNKKPCLLVRFSCHKLPVAESGPPPPIYFHGVVAHKAVTAKQKAVWLHTCNTTCRIAVWLKHRQKGTWEFSWVK